MTKLIVLPGGLLIALCQTRTSFKPVVFQVCWRGVGSPGLPDSYGVKANKLAQTGQKGGNASPFLAVDIYLFRLGVWSAGQSGKVRA